MVRVLPVPIAAVILAAGDSSRMGYPKALLPMFGETFLSRIARTLRSAGLPDLTAVVGKHAEEIRQRTRDEALRFIVNSRPELGQISSMQLAFEHMDPSFTAALIWPVDQPAVSGTVIRGLVDLYRATDATIVMPTYAGMPGHPVIFRRDFCRALLELPQGASPKRLVRSHMGRAALFPTDEPGVVNDVDTPEDYLRLTGDNVEQACRKLRE